MIIYPLEKNKLLRITSYANIRQTRRMQFFYTLHIGHISFQHYTLDVSHIISMIVVIQQKVFLTNSLLLTYHVPSLYASR